MGAPSRAIKARPVTCSNTSNTGKSAQASQDRAASNYYNHDITIFADASNISTQARVLPGCFASSGVHGAFIAVPYVERSLTSGSEKRFSLCCPGNRRVVGGIGPYIVVKGVSETPESW